MGVTNFTSILSIQSQGAGDVNKLVTAFDALSNSIDRANTKSKDLSNHPGFDDFASKVKKGISDPLGAIGDIAETALKSLGPLGVGVTAGAAIFVKFATSGYDAAKSLGSFSDSIRDTATRLGVTNQSAADLGFSMKRAGSDIGSIEGVLKKLSQGLTDSSEEGAKARKGLVELGVSAYDGTAKMLPMSSILTQLSEKLGAVEEPAKRNALAISILGKGALTALPDILQLNEGLRRAHELGLAPTDNDIARWQDLQHQTAEVDAQLERITRKLKDPIAAVWSVTIRGFANDTSDIGEAGFKALQSQIGKISPGEAQRRLDSTGGFFSASDTAEIQKLINDKIATEIGGSFRSGLSVSNSIFGNRITAALGSPTDEGRLTSAKEELKTLQDTLRADTQLHKPISDDDLKAVELQQKAVLAIEAQIKAVKELEEAKKHNLELDKQSADIFAKAFFGDSTNPASARQATLAKIEASRTADLAKFPSGAAGINRDYDQQKYAAWITYIDASAKSLREFNDDVAKAAQESPDLVAKILKQQNDTIDSRLKSQGVVDASGGLNPAFFGATQTFSAPAGYRSPEQKLRDAQDNARRSQGLFSSQAALSGLSDGATISGELALRQQSALKIFNAEKAIADLKENAAERYISNLDAEDRRDQAIFDAKLERDQKLLDLAVRAKDAFASGAVGLFDALKSGGVSSFLKGELNKLSDSVVGNAAKLAYGDPTKGTGLSGLIPHASGGIFGKLLQGTPFGPDALKDATAENTLATIENTAAYRAIALSASGGGGSGGGNWGTAARNGGIFSALGLRSPSGGGIYTNSGLASDTGYTSDGVPRYSPESYGPDGSYLGPGATGGSDPSIRLASSSTSGLGRGVGIAGAVVGGGFGIYSGLHAGGAQGGLTAAGSAAGLVGSLASLIPAISTALPALGPIGLGLGAALGLVSSLIGDPKKNRADELTGYARDRQTSVPTGTTYSQDLYGRGVDTDYLGHSRSYVTVTYNINALDSQSFQQFLIANPGPLGAGIAAGVSGGNMDDAVQAVRAA
jgi:hypothetical protein